MARKVTVTRMMTRARERADMVNSGFITDSELRGYISSSYTELYELLIQSGLIYFNPQTENIVADGSESYPLPDDYYGTMRVDYQWSSNYWTELFEYLEPERTMFENVFSGGATGYATHWSVQGGNLVLLPAPSGGTYRHRYIPAPADLEIGNADQVTIDGVGGWEEWVIVDAARKMLAKEESSTAHLERDLARLKERIEESALNRAWASPRRVIDVRNRTDESQNWWYYAGTAD